MTHTYALLEVTAAVYDEIKGKLLAAGYHPADVEVSGEIDMHGIALIREAPTDEPRWVTKAQMREVARMLRPQITDSEFDAMWAENRLEAYRRWAGE